MRIALTFTDRVALVAKNIHFLYVFIPVVIICVVEVECINRSDFQCFEKMFEDLDYTEGQVVGVKKTNIVINDIRVKEYMYQFFESGNVQTGSSFGSSDLAVDDTVRIEFVADDITVSRIVDMNHSPLPFWVSLIIGIFFLVILCVLISLLRGIREYFLILNDFSITTGRWIEAEDRSSHHGKSYRIKYLYDHEGIIHYYYTYTPSPDNYGEIETLIYSNKNPESSCLLIDLPIKLQNKISEKS